MTVAVGGCNQILSERIEEGAEDIVSEGKTIWNTIWKTNIRCALNAVDTSSRGFNTSILLRLHTWLCISRSEPEVQQHLLNLPFNREYLFGFQVNKLLAKVKKDMKIAKSMATLQSPVARGSILKQQPRRGTKPT